MSLFGLTPSEIAERVRLAAALPPPPTLKRSLAEGTLGFGLTGAVAIGFVGCGRAWMFDLFGSVGPYLVAAALFVLLGGGALGRLVIGPGRMVRFYAVFTVAFFAYAAVWTVAYFELGGIRGELVGCLVGAPATGIVLGWAFGATKALPRIAFWLTVTSTAGYFLGRLPYAVPGGNVGMVLFGGVFGAFFGLGLGYALFVAQAPVREILGRQAPPAGEP